MSKPVTRVFIEYNTEYLPAYAFTLNDFSNGKLDNTFARLGGVTLVEITPYLQQIDLERGKTRVLDRFDAGLMNVQFDNSGRVFDPQYSDSPLYGAIIPRLRIQVTANDVIVYTGVVLDWNIEYDVGGNSIATAVCSDRFTILTQTLLEEYFNDVQLSGERITEILARPEVEWDINLQDIDDGLTIVQGELIPSNTDALSYFQLIETTEQGALFIAKDGKLTFRQRNTSPTLETAFSNDGIELPYTGISVVYGSELLFNRIEITPLDYDTQTVDDALSQEAYGLSVLALKTLHEFDTDAANSALVLAFEFSQPEYRFETLEVDLGSLTSLQQAELLGLELNDLVIVSFTPSNIPPAINLSAKVLGISHEIDGTRHFITFNLGSTAGISFVLDSPLLGVLDVDTLSY